MNSIEALQPLTRVFQLLGLSVTQIPTFRNIPLHRITKYYSLLLIAIRLCTVWYVLAKCQLTVISSTQSFIIDKIMLGCVELLEVIILIEAFIKFRQEESLMDSFLQVDAIMMHHFDIDLKLNELRKSAVHRLIVWMSIVGLYFTCLWFTHYNTQYFHFILIWTLSVLTASFTYFQIITWTDLIRYRLHIVNRLMNVLKFDDLVIFDHNAIDDTDTHIFDKFCVLFNLYNQLWMQTNRLNKRFKFSMMFSITYDFIYLVVQLYYIYICLRKSGPCDFFPTDVAASVINIFHLSMICRAGQSVADEALQVAYAVHRNKFNRKSAKLNSFVCSKLLRLFSIFAIPEQIVYLRTCTFLFRFENFRIDCFIKQFNSMYLSFLISTIHSSSR